MSLYGPIRQAIISKIKSEATKIQATYRAPTATMSGFPAAVVAPSSNESDYQSTDRDKQTIVFYVRIFNLIEDEATREQSELDLEEALDEMLTIFRPRNALGTACDWVSPAPGIWEEVAISDKVYLMGEITLRCVKHQ